MKPQKYLILVIVISALVVLVYLLFIQQKNKDLISTKETTTVSQPLMIDGRLLVGVIPPEVNKKKIIYTNKIAPNWVTLLKKIL